MESGEKEMLLNAREFDLKFQGADLIVRWWGASFDVSSEADENGGAFEGT